MTIALTPADRAELLAMWVDPNVSARQIQAHFDVHPDTLRRFARDAGLGERPREGLWTAERLEILRSGVAAGLAFSQIAQKIGHGCTRNAAIGKSLRMGFKQPGRASNPGTVRASRPAPNRTYRFAAAPRITARNQVFVEPAPRPARAAAPGPEPIGPTARPLAELSRQMCRWGLTDPGRGRMDETLFCGVHVEDGPYCSHHARKAHQPLAAGRPRTANDLARSLRRYV